MADRHLIAIHEIHLCEKPGKAATATAPAVPPVTKVIPPRSKDAAKAKFTASQEVASDLTASGAAIYDKEAESAPAKKAPAKKAPAKAAAKAPAKSDAKTDTKTETKADDNTNAKDDGEDMV